MDDVKREYIRVTTTCPILYRVLNTESNAVVKLSQLDPISLIESQKIAPKIDLGSDQANGQMMDLLLWIDWKLNYLIKAQSREQEKKIFPHEGIVNNLSGSGLGFSSERDQAVGTRLQFKLILPVLPFNEMSIDAVVVHAMRHEGNEQSKYEIGLEYVDITEEDREAIFRFIVQRERKIRLVQRKVKASERSQ